MFTRAAILALTIFGSISSAVADDAPIQQIQFRGGPGGQCPRGYDFNYSNGRCYPNEYHAPGAYARPNYHRYRSCPDGDCYPYRRRAPRAYDPYDY